MAGYAVSTRVGAVAPRRARRVSSRLDGDPTTSQVGDDEAPVDLAGRSLEAVVEEHWEQIRERWSQLTFFLFDTDSWRR